MSLKIVLGIALGTLGLCYLTRSLTPLAVVVVTAFLTACLYPMLSM